MNLFSNVAAMTSGGGLEASRKQVLDEQIDYVRVIDPVAADALEHSLSKQPTDEAARMRGIDLLDDSGRRAYNAAILALSFKDASGTAAEREPVKGQDTPKAGEILTRLDLEERQSFMYAIGEQLTELGAKGWLYWATLAGVVVVGGAVVVGAAAGVAHLVKSKVAA